MTANDAGTARDQWRSANARSALPEPYQRRAGS